MNSDKILQSNFLDLLFENRNKAYGAYELCKNYGYRLRKAIFSTLSLMLLLFFILSSFKKNEPIATRRIGQLDDIGIERVKNEPDKPKEKPQPIQEKPKGNPANQIKPNVYSTPLIVNTVKTPVVDLSAPSNPLGTATTGTITGGPVGTPPGTGTPSTNDTIATKTIPVTVPIAEPELPTTDAYYKGGKEAFGEYLQDKLGDEALEDGENKRIVVSFTIEADGSITNITTSENNDADFINKTIKAFMKMKKWQPALVKGKAIVTQKVIPVVITPQAD